MMGASPSAGIFSMGVEEAYRWKDSVQSEAEIRIWFADGVANGLRPWFTKFAGVLRDRRWLGVVEELYQLASPAPSATCGTRRRWPGSAWSTRSRPPGSTAARAPGQKVEDHALGWYQALIEARIPFEMVHDRLLDADHLGRFKTLILPNIAALSDEQCRQLREFVDRGGSLVATYETSLYDEWGARRRTSAWRDLFGVAFGAAAPRGRCGTPISGSRTTAARAGGIRSWTAWTTPRGSSTGPTGSTSAPARVPAPAADAHPELPGPADGEGLPPRTPGPRSPSCTCARWAAAVSSISPGTSTASSGRSWPSTTGPCSETPCGGRRTRSRRSGSPAPAMLDVTVWRQAAR